MDISENTSFYLNPNPYLYLHLIFDTIGFDILSLMKWIFFSKIELHFVGYTGSKNLVQTRKKIQCFKLEIVKNQVQIYRGLSKVQFNMYIEVFFVSITLSSNNTVGVVKYL